MIYFTKGNFFGNLLHPFELKYWKFIIEPPYPYNMCGIDLYSMYLTYPYRFKNIFTLTYIHFLKVIWKMVK